MKSLIGYCLLLITQFVLLTGCSTMPTSSNTPSTSKASWEQRQTALNKISHWQINGKIAVQTANDAGSATIDWAQSQQHYNISLMGPLGANGMKLNGGPGQVTMVTADGKQFTASSAEQLLAKQWGYNLPVSHLIYWVRGLPVPGVATQQQYDAWNRLSSLTQQGWHVEYLNYTSHNGVDLPQRINVSSPSLNAKLVIYQWQL